MSGLESEHIPPLFPDPTMPFDAKTFLLAGLSLALIVAVVTDLRSRLIHNELNAAIALTAPLYWWASDMGLWPDVAVQLGLAAVVFVGFYLLFAVGQMGGGDVKLLTALALWVPPGAFASLLVVAIPVGWVLTMVLGTWHVARAENGKPKGRRNTFILVLCSLAAMNFASGLLGGPKLAFPESLFGANPSPLLLLTGLLGTMLTISITAYVLLRPHRKAIRTPYGVAIAAGGLALIASGSLNAALA